MALVNPDHHAISMSEDATRIADLRASVEHTDMIVYYRAHDELDPYGRKAVWYVRSVDDERPYQTEIVYRAHLTTEEE